MFCNLYAPGGDGMGQLDHIVITAPELGAGVAWLEDALGVSMSGGGAHLGRGTHNKLLSLGPDTYLEVIAPNPEDTQVEMARMYDLDNNSAGIGLTNWAISSNSISDTMAMAPTAMGEIAQLSRGPNRWLMSAPLDGKLPFDEAFPGFLEWQTPPPAPLLPETGCRLQSLEITHPNGVLLAKTLAPFIDDPRVKITTGAQKSLRAVISTPSGTRVLE